MADFVAGDVVARLRMDSTQFTQAMQAAQQQFSRLQGALSQLRTQQSASQQALTQQTQALTQMSRASTQAAASVSGLGRALAVAGGIGVATSIGAIVGQMKALAVETVQTGMRLEALRASLSALGGGPTAGAQQFQMLTDMAQRLGVALEPLARGWRTLTAAATQAGLPLADQVRLLEALSKEARRTGASNDDLGRAIQAVGQMASKGKVSMEELRQQLGEALGTSMAAAARGMGQTTEALITLVETGTLGFASFARALTRGFEELQAGSGKLADTSQQAFTRLGTAWKGLADAIMQSGVDTYFVTVINNAKEAVEWTAKAFKGAPTTVPIGPQYQDMGLGPSQTQQLQRLDAALARAQAGVTGARTTQRQEELGKIVTELTRQREELMGSAQATQAQADAQAKVTLEVNKTLGAHERQADFVTDLTKALAEVNKQVTEYRQKAALAPELADAEQQLRALGDIRRKGAEGIATLIQGRAPGTTVPAELLAQFQALRQGYASGEAAIKAMDAAEKARATTERQAIQDAATHQAAIDKVTMSLAQQEDQALQTLKAIQARFFQDKEARAIDTVAEIQQQFPSNDAIQAQAAQLKTSLETRDAYLAEVEALKERFTALKQNADAQREVEATAEKFTQDVSERLAALQTPREERLSAQFRRRAERQGVDLTPQLAAQLRLIDEQMRWNTLMDHAERIGDQAAQTITSGLLRMTEGTVAVAEGFRAMAKDILDSMAQIALNETFKTLFGLGLGLLGGAARGALTSTTPTTVGNSPSYMSTLLGNVPRGAEGLGPINRPTLAMIGEGRQNEYVLNQTQLQQTMTSALRSGAGGSSAQDVSVILVDNRQQAEVAAAQQRAMGRSVIIQEVANELSQGSGSRLGQLIKTIQR